MEYIIYCRKSSDESSGKQEQSIADQVSRCIKYAKENDIKIALKPNDFSDFENENDLDEEDNDSDITNRRIYQETRHLFIIKESKSAKMAGNRPKWKKLIQYIKKHNDKKITTGILSYSPDRQARNILEGGELINLVDEDKVFLKYTNFHFENTASGKMMLGVWFVFAKQYSDGISENVIRGNQTTVERGKALGHTKFGFSRSEDGFYVPDENFDLIQEAFHMKIHDQRTDVYIAQWLNDRGWIKKRGSGEENMTGNKLRVAWRDPFYYGKFMVADYTSDQIQDNPYYKPVITFEEYEILQDRLGNPKTKELRVKIKDEYHEINGIPQLMLKSEDGYSLTINLPNKKNRFIPKLLELQKDNPNATLKDVVKSNQIRFGVKQRASEYNGLEITFDLLENQIIEFLNGLKINKNQYNEYVEFMKIKLKELYNQTIEEAQRLQLRVNGLRGAQREYIEKNMSIEKDEVEMNIYNKKKVDYGNKIKRLENDISKLHQAERSTVIEYEMLLDIIQRASSFYKKANYVQKAKICEILFLNMVLDRNKVLHIQPKPALQELFKDSILSMKKAFPKENFFGAEYATRTRNLIHGKDML